MKFETHQKVTASHLSRQAYLYVRQSTVRQVFENTESTKRQYALRQRAVALGWRQEQVTVIDSDQGQSGASTDREGFQRLVTEVGMGRAIRRWPDRFPCIVVMPQCPDDVWWDEAIEDIDPGPVDAIRAVGGNGFQVLLYAILPQVLPQVLSVIIFEWEINIRRSAILGLVALAACLAPRLRASRPDLADALREE